jgi:hypothetical protein
LLYSFGGQTLEGNPHHYAGLDMVSNIWFDESAEAAYKIQEATSLFTKCVAGKTVAFSRLLQTTDLLPTEHNCPDALPDLPLCSEANATQWAQLYGKVTSSYYSISQFNYAFVNVWPWAYPLQTAINLTLAASSPGEVLAVPLRGVSWAEDGCIDPNNRNLTGQPTFFGDSFQWIRCTYFPGSFGDSRPGSLLPPSNTTVGGDCWSPYAVPWQAPDFNETNEYFVEKFNLTLKTLDQAERLLIVQGTWDIVAAYGSPQLTMTSDRNHSRLITMHDLAHTEDSFSYAAIPRGLRTATDQIRDIKLNYIKEWLGLI